MTTIKPNQKAIDSMHILWNMVKESKCLDVFTPRWYENTDSEDCDWSTHNSLDGWTWYDGSPYIEFCGTDGPVIILGEEIVVRKTFQGEHREAVPTFLILKPETWVEYGMPMTDYEVYESADRTNEALGFMARLLVSDLTSRFYPLFDENYNG